MAYKNYNVFSDEVKQKIKENGNCTDLAMKINKLLHYTKKVDNKTIAQSLRAGATPNKFLFAAIEKYFAMN